MILPHSPRDRPSPIAVRKVAMSIRRSLFGVLEVVTPAGAHYLCPSPLERVYLLWMFRNFRTLPLTVLTNAQRRKIESMVAKYRRANPRKCDEILGSVELGAQTKRPVRAAVSGMHNLGGKSRSA